MSIESYLARLTGIHFWDNEMKIYLAGPISGCTFEGCTDWRGDFAELIPRSIQCLSPMRGKNFLKKKGIISGSYEEDGPFATRRGIMTRDFFDCTRVDLVVANLLNAEKVSIGSCMEIAWTFQTRTPLIVIMEEGNIHEHPMILEATGFLVETIREAAFIAKTILCPPAVNR